MKKLNQSQQAAVDLKSPRLLLIAGPGSGKTETLARRIKRMIYDGVDPASIVCITFTNMAAAELMKRFDAVVVDTMTQCGVDALASPAYKPIRLGYCGTLHGFMLRLLQKHGQVIGLANSLTVLDEEEWQAVRERVVTLLGYKGTVKDLDLAFKLPLQHYRRAARVEVREWSSAQQVAYEAYFQTITNGAITFDAILELGLELVVHLRKQVGGDLKKFDHLLVDEYQDSGWQDDAIYEALPVNTRFWVGDYDQSIYAFRGGDVDIMLKQAANPETDVLELFENYRSRAAICKVANRLISHNVKRLPKECIPQLNGKIDGAAVYCIRHESGVVEAGAILTDISTRIKMPGTLAFKPEECAVLCRTNKLAAAFRKLFTEAGLPVHAKTVIQMPHDWAAARAFITLLTNPENDLTAHKFLTLKLGAAKADEMKRQAGRNFQSINRQFMKIKNVQMADATSACVSAGISTESIALVAAQVKLLPDGTMLELQYALAQQDVPEAGHGVTITTLHAAKGREFDNVWIPAIEEDFFPGRDDVEESRRLLFVGITRARKYLMVSCAKVRNKEWSGTIEVKPSRFFEEISCTG